MPIISRFLGITLKMYFRQSEHNPPHIHASSGDYAGLFSIETGEMFEGDIPPKEQVLVQQFVKHYNKELHQMWETQQFKMLPPIK